MLSQNHPLARPDLPSPPSPPPQDRHVHGRLQSRRNPGSAPILANKAVVAAPAGAALPPLPSRNAPFNFARPGPGPPIPRKPFLTAQRSNGSTIGSPLRRGHSIAVSIPTPSESASSSGGGDQEDDSGASSDVEHIQVPERPVPGILRLPRPMGDLMAHSQGPWPPPGSSFSHSVLSAPRFTPIHPPSNSSSRSASSGTTQTRRVRRRIARRRIWADVADQRSKVHRLRETMRMKRIELQARRHQTDRADNEFMQIIRPLLVALSPVALPAETIRERLQVLQRARDAYYGAESAYGDQEAKLDHEEHRLHALELELQRFLDDQRGGENDASSGTSDGEKGEVPTDYHKAHADHVNNNHTATRSTHENDTKQVNIDTSQNSPPESDNGLVPRTGKHDTLPSDPDHVKNNADKRDEVDPTSNSRYILLGIDGDRAEDIHPLYQKLLNAAADRELAIEHHTEMHRRHDRILKDLEMDLHRERARANRGSQLSDGDLLSLKSSLTGFPPSVEEFKKKFRVPIDQDDLEFLRDYEVEVEIVRRVMEAADQEVFRLKALCEEKGAMRKNPPYEEEFTIVKGTSMATRLPEGNMALNHRPAPNLSHPIFSTLLSNPMHVLQQKTPMAALKEVMQMPKDSPGAALGRINCMKELGISRLMQKPENKTDYINQWLIHRLRTSPMEVELLFSISTGFLRIMNLRRWQEDVLAHWKTDDAAGALGPSPERSRTTRDEVAADDDTGESDGSDSSEVDNSDLDSLQRARSDDEDTQSHSRRSGAIVEASTKSSPLLR